MASLLPKASLGAALGGAPRRATRSRHAAAGRAVSASQACPAQLCSRTQRRRTVQCQAFFSFFTPKPAAAAVNPRTAELVQEVIDLSSGTDAGAKASPQRKEQIAAAVGLGYCHTCLVAKHHPWVAGWMGARGTIGWVGGEGGRVCVVGGGGGCCGPLGSRPPMHVGHLG